MHEGHLRSADEVRTTLQLHTMALLPAKVPPHASTEASAEQRLAMLQLALAEFPRLQLDTRELQRDGTSYTVFSCREYRQQFPDAVIYWCLGTDAFNHFCQWHRWQEILERVNILVVMRPDKPLAGAVARRLSLQPWQPQAEPAKAGRVFSLQPRQIPVSSTLLRQQLRNSDKLPAYMPYTVWQYIQTHNLYSV